MVNTKLPNSTERPPGTIIRVPCHDPFFEDGDGNTRFKRANEIHIIRTQHLINLLCYTTTEQKNVLPFLFDMIIKKELEERSERGEEVSRCYLPFNLPWRFLYVIFLFKPHYTHVIFFQN